MSLLSALAAAGVALAGASGPSGPLLVQKPEYTVQLHPAGAEVPSSLLATPGLRQQRMAIKGEPYTCFLPPQDFLQYHALSAGQQQQDQMTSIAHITREELDLALQGYHDSQQAKKDKRHPGGKGGSQQPPAPNACLSLQDKGWQYELCPGGMLRRKPLHRSIGETPAESGSGGGASSSAASGSASGAGSAAGPGYDLLGILLAPPPAESSGQGAHPSSAAAAVAAWSTVGAAGADPLSPSSSLSAAGGVARGRVVTRETGDLVYEEDLFAWTAGTGVGVGAGQGSAVEGAGSAAASLPPSAAPPLRTGTLRVSCGEVIPEEDEEAGEGEEEGVGKQPVKGREDSSSSSSSSSSLFQPFVSLESVNWVTSRHFEVEVLLGSRRACRSLVSISSILSSIEKLCFIRKEGWWTTELCVGEHAQQFRMNAEGNSRSAEILLGRLQEQVEQEADEGEEGEAGPTASASSLASSSSSKAKSAGGRKSRYLPHRLVPASLADQAYGKVSAAVQQVYAGGAACDILPDKPPRRAAVRYVCREEDQQAMAAERLEEQRLSAGAGTAVAEGGGVGGKSREAAVEEVAASSAARPLSTVAAPSKKKHSQPPISPGSRMSYFQHLRERLISAASLIEMREDSTCRYSFLVSLPEVCLHPALQTHSQAVSAAIHCYPAKTAGAAAGGREGGERK